MKGWLLLRGLARKKEHWTGFAEKLESATGDKVLCLDLPGMGEASEEPILWKTSAIVENLRERWIESDENALIPNWNILGHSFGGMIALQWISEFKTDFNKAVIINTSSSDLLPLYKRLKIKSLPLFLSILLEHNIRKREEKILKLVSSLKYRDESVIQKWVQFSSNENVSKLLILSQLVAASTFKSPPEISIPTLFLNSMKDQMVDPMGCVELAEKYNSLINSNSEAGHDLTLDCPDWVIEKILSFEKKSKIKEKTVSY